MTTADILEKIHRLFVMAREDPKYAVMTGEYNELERQFTEMVREMPEEKQDIMWAFLCVSDGMNWRMMEMILERFEIDV